MDDAARRATAAMWALGDYAAIGERLQPAADELVAAVADRLGDGPGHGGGRRALDLATGTGSVALRLARRGWAVSATDLCPPLLEIARAEAAAAGLDVDLREAPLDEQPYDDQVFDAVTSSFGLIFAADEAAVLAEVRRLVRAGGVLAFTAWTPGGYLGQMSTVMGRFLPSGPPGGPDPLAWGRPEVVLERLGAFGDPAVAVHTLPWRFPGPDAAVDFCFEHSPAHVAAARRAGPDAPAMRDAVREHLVEQVGGEGPVDLEAEYLLVTAVRR